MSASKATIERKKSLIAMIEKRLGNSELDNQEFIQLCDRYMKLCGFHWRKTVKKKRGEGKPFKPAQPEWLAKVLEMEAKKRAQKAANA